jgi:hypothetical protein
MQWEQNLGNWSIGGWRNIACYVVSVLVLSTAIRAIVSWVRAIKPAPIVRGRYYCWHRWWTYFRPSTAFDLDPTILGTLELFAYPVLMKFQAWPIIGAWLGFKTLAQWDAWKRGRAEYNLFLIGNALVLVVSFLILTPQVSVKPPAYDGPMSRAASQS